MVVFLKSSEPTLQYPLSAHLLPSQTRLPYWIPANVIANFIMHLPHPFCSQVQPCMTSNCTTAVAIATSYNNNQNSNISSSHGNVHNNYRRECWETFYWVRTHHYSNVKSLFINKHLWWRNNHDLSLYGLVYCISIVLHTHCALLWIFGLTHWGRVTHICVSKFPSLVQIMACRLVGAKSLSEPVLECC